MSLGAEAKFTRGVSGLTGREVRLIRVGKSITSPFRQIADAIQASKPNDRIEIESGKYFETITIQHPLELCSAKDGEPPVIISRGPCLTIRTDGPVLIQRLTILAKGSKASESQGVLIEQGSPIIRNCEISSLYVTNDASPQVSHCQIQNSDHGFGLSITGNSSGIYENNDISYHNAGCVHINTSGKPDLHSNRITQKHDQCSSAVFISGRLLTVCEPCFRENIIRGGGGTSAQDEMDPASVHSPQMLAETNANGWTGLVCVMDGAVPFLMGNLLCNGIGGFYFKNCNIPPDHFRGNRIVNCVGWGIIVAEEALLCVQGNDILSCGGGIHVYTNSSSNSNSNSNSNNNLKNSGHSSNGGNSSSSSSSSSRVTLLKCDLKKNVHYGVLIDHSVVTMNECNISESSIGVALFGNCADCIISKNVLTNNTLADFSITRHGVATIENNIISGSHGNSTYGIMVQNSSHLTLLSNVIVGKATSVYIRGGSSLVAEKNALRESSVHHVVLVESSKATLKENTLESTACATVVVTEKSECTARGNVMYSSLKEGILVEKGGKANLERNSMSSMEETIYVKSGGYVYVEENDVTLGYHGIVVEGEGSNCMVMNNRFCNMRATAVYALEQATVTIKGNSLTGIAIVGIQVGLSAKALVENNTVKKCKGGAIHIDGLGTECQVLQCRMESVEYGIRCSRGCSAVIQGNQIRFCKSFGVSCELSESVTVYENNIFGADNGIILSGGGGDFHDNHIEECEVGILAAADAFAMVKDHKILNCTVGLLLQMGTYIRFSHNSIQKSKQFGVMVQGPSVDVHIREVTIEESGIAGVYVRAGGACSFIQCILENTKENAIQLEEAGNVVFKQCMMNHQRCGVLVMSTETQAELPQLVNCTIDGNNCEEGVVCHRNGMIRLELCKIRACCKQKGSGIVIHDGAGIVLSHCDIIECSHVGMMAAPTSHVLAEHTTIHACKMGIMFTSPNENESHSQNCKESTVNSKTNTHSNNSSHSHSYNTTQQKVFPRYTQMMIKDCTEAGIYYEPHSCGMISYTTVEKCRTGVLVESESCMVLQTTVIIASTDCGIVLCGQLAKDSELSDLTISDSVNYGLKVTESDFHDNNNLNTNTDNETFITIESTEITRNGKGGVLLLFPRVSLERCTISQNTAAGMVCKGNGQPRLKKCHFEHNKEFNLEIQSGSVPDIQDCVFEHAPIGVRVESAVHMKRCIVQQLDVGVVFNISDPSSVSSTILECAFANNSTGLSSAGEISSSSSDGSTDGSLSILMEKCVFNDNSGVSVSLEKGPQVQVRACRFESSTDAIKVLDEAETVIDRCNFNGNSKAISTLSAKRVEIKKCQFIKQIKFSVNIMGNYGEARILDNNFSGSGQHGIFLSSEGIVVLVSDNTFEGEFCGMFIQDTPQIRVYNNRFLSCQTGMVLSGSESSGRIFSNVFDKNKIACRCEQESSPQIWRNAFEASSNYGILSITGAKPIVVDNIFDKNSESGSASVCVRNGGVGHFALNRYTNNACALCLEDTGETVLVNNSMFLGNTLGIQIKEGAAVNTIGCTFAESISGDIQAFGRIEQGRCVFAYNSFASKRCNAVTVSEYATIIMFRCLFFGEDGKGFIQGNMGTGMVVECLFYELPCGVLIQENGNGTIMNSVFIRCVTAVEVLGDANPLFYNCLFLSQPHSKLVVLNTSLSSSLSSPTFHLCNFVGVSKIQYPLLSASGGGLVENSSFITGGTAVLLEDGCTLTLRKNIFLAGNIGITMNERSQGKVEGNSFYRHSVAAVKIMENASGELTGNAFEQPLENGAILAGPHNVIIDACKVLDSSKDRTVKRTIDEKSTESQFITVILDYLRAAPYWVRRGMSEISSTSLLPESILAVMCAKKEEEEEEKRTEPGEEEEEKEQKTAEQEKEEEEKKKEKDKSKAKAVEGIREDKNISNKKELQKQDRGGKKKSNKGAQKRKLVEEFSFVPSDCINSIPKNVQDTLLAWVNHQGITLSVEKPKRSSIPDRRNLSISIGMLKDVDDQVTAVAQFKRDRERGMTTVGNETDKVRGANTKHHKLKKDEKEPVVSTHNVSQEGTEKLSTIDTLQDSLPSPPTSIGEGASTTVLPVPIAATATTTTTTTTTTAITSKTNKTRQSSRRTVKSGEQKCSRAAKHTARKRRRFLPPPLRSTAENAQPRKPPHRGPLSTIAGCMYACRAETVPHRKPRKKIVPRSTSISMVGESGIMDFSVPGGSYSMLLDAEESAIRSEKANASRSGYSNISKSSYRLSFGSLSLERRIRSRGSSKLGSSILFEAKEGNISHAESSGQLKSGDSPSLAASLRASLRAGSLVQLNEMDESAPIEGSSTEVSGKHGELRVEKHFKGKRDQKKDNNDDNNDSRSSSGSGDLLKTINDAGETQPCRSGSQGVLEGMELDTESDDSTGAVKKRRKFPFQKGVHKTEGVNAKKGINNLNDSEGSASNLEISQLGIVNAESGLPGSLGVGLNDNTDTQNLVDGATGKKRLSKQYKSSNRHVLGDNDPSNLFSSFDTLQTSDQGDGTDLGKSRQGKEGVKSMKKVLTQDKKNKEESLSPADDITAADQTIESLTSSVSMAKRNKRECMTRAPPKKKKGVAALSRQQKDKTLTYSESGKELSTTSLDHYKSKSSGESVERKGTQEGYVVSMATLSSTTYPTAASLSSPSKNKLHEKQHQGKEELFKGTKTSSESSGTVYLPRLTASSLPSSVLSSRLEDSSDATDELRTIALSERGCDLLEQLQQNVLQTDTALQKRLQALREEAKVRKKAKSPEAAAASASARVSPTLRSTPGGLSTIGSYRSVDDTRIWKEGEGEGEEEEEEEMEDIIALLRWLADMRQKKLLSNNRFNLAVESIRENTNVPFFLCEGNSAGGAPTLIVRLPKTEDEAVVIPLLEDTPLEMETVTQQILQEYGENTKIQLRTPSPNDTASATHHPSMMYRRPSLPLLSYDEKRRRRNMEQETLDTPVVPHKKSGKPPLYMAYAKLPRGHFNGRKELPEVLKAAFKSRPWQQASLHYPVIQDSNDTQAAHPYGTSTTLALHGNGKDTNSLLTLSKALRHPEQLLPFNPANPQASSPYNKSPGVAAYIATGTKNFMV
ncbi:uncharacterized protein TM35_000093270 [Trypanosoma theileri]|uniref:Right handed beta helix domain-containing protein n=1 Tax=Trypanosoma theileri TaxID=67003 RepID=A0A1X0P007_9TRYP|nr:uncharacterized protein TM35_000093270 [Trypanosoma theileri]ORC90277.1 hypothetical protein TM35_000093270 [Trypanosoma theileri]